MKVTGEIFSFIKKEKEPKRQDTKSTISEYQKKPYTAASLLLRWEPMNIKSLE